MNTEDTLSGFQEFFLQPIIKERSNNQISGAVRSFVCRSRLQLIECNSLLHLYYGVPKHCQICKFPSDTISHILNTCPHFKNDYQRRHNRIVDLIFDKIKFAVKDKSETIEIYKDSFIKPNLFYSDLENFINPHNRPDIFTIDQELKHVTITEVSVPFDAHLDKCNNEKFNKYSPLGRELDELGYSVTIVVLIIGSLGHVHKRFVSGLKLAGLNQTNAKFLAKYCSISAIIGSYKVWQQRCKKTKFH